MAAESFLQEFLDTHNSYRAMHNVPALTYNSELNAAAQKWADHLLEQNSLKHSDTNDGENVFYMSSSKTVNPTGKEAVDSWYSEIKDYDFSKSGFQRGTGHFTQVVWKDSKELGVGLATDGHKVFVVGQYRPAGNFTNPGYFEKNVIPKGQDSTGTNRKAETQPDPKNKEPASETKPKSSDKSFLQEFLDTHNSYRAMHNVPSLTYNSELNAAAQKWADHLLEQNSLGHSSTDDGENVFYMSSSKTVNPTGKEAVDSWYSEIKDYDFSKSGFQRGTGHFTQVVWKDSQELGVGLATDGHKVLVVGQYRPAGNITNDGYFEKNVIPKGQGSTGTNSVAETKPDLKSKETAPETKPKLAAESFLQEFLDTHNSYRAMHKAPPLTYNSELNATAQKWADHLLEQNCLKHSDTNDGENVFYMSSSKTVTPTGKEAVDSWYSEIKDYDFSKSGFHRGTGHFTQVVWKDSKELGVGLATDGHKVFVVGQYRPAGNFTNPGYFEKNVIPKE